MSNHKIVCVEWITGYQKKTGQCQHDFSGTCIWLFKVVEQIEKQAEQQRMKQVLLVDAAGLMDADSVDGEYTRSGKISGDRNLFAGVRQI